jgi:hypothetical protein
MKSNYKGFELDVKREKCLGGWNQVYVCAYHEEYGEVISTHYDDEDTVATHMKDLKRDIDEILENPSLLNEQVYGII